MKNNLSVRAWNFNKEFNKSRISNFYCKRVRELEFEKSREVKFKKVDFKPSIDFEFCETIYIYYEKT